MNVTGLLALAGKFFAPVMALWGLPGEAIMVLFSALMSMGGAVGVCMALYNDGGIDERAITIVIPAIYLLGSKIQYLGRFARHRRRAFQTLPGSDRHLLHQRRHCHVHHENFDHVICLKMFYQNSVPDNLERSFFFFLTPFDSKETLFLL